VSCSPEESDDAPRAPRGGLRELEIGLPGVHRGAMLNGLGVGSRSSATDADPMGPALSRRASRGCPVLKSGIADREDEPSLPIRPWPAGVPVEPGLLLRSHADKSARPSVADCARRPVCAVQRPDGGHSGARAWSFARGLGRGSRQRSRPVRAWWPTSPPPGRWRRRAVTDPRTWPADSWASDLGPHLAYGLATAAAYEAFRGPIRPDEAASPVPAWPRRNRPG
jgi:hypothetical protein